MNDAKFVRDLYEKVKDTAGELRSVNCAVSKRHKHTTVYNVVVLRKLRLGSPDGMLSSAPWQATLLHQQESMHLSMGTSAFAWTAEFRRCIAVTRNNPCCPQEQKSCPIRSCLPEHCFTSYGMCMQVDAVLTLMHDCRQVHRAYSLGQEGENNCQQ